MGHFVRHYVRPQVMKLLIDIHLNAVYELLGPLLLFNFQLDLSLAQVLLVTVLTGVALDARRK